MLQPFFRIRELWILAKCRGKSSRILSKVPVFRLQCGEQWYLLDAELRDRWQAQTYQNQLQWRKYTRFLDELWEKSTGTEHAKISTSLPGSKLLWHSPPQSRTHVTYFSKIPLIAIHYQKTHEIPILVKTQALECHQTPRILSNILIIAHGH